MDRLSILTFAIVAVAGLNMAIMHFESHAAAPHARGRTWLAAGCGAGRLWVAELPLRGRAFPSGLVVGHALPAMVGFVTFKPGMGLTTLKRERQNDPHWSGHRTLLI
jgi:hypothetical protein